MSMMRRSRYLCGWIFAFLASLIATNALAQHACSWSVDNVAFGVADVLGGGAVDVTSTVNIDCSGGLASLVVRACPNIGAGSGGATSSTRHMSNGSNLLNYQLYQDAARTTVWGSSLWGFADPPPTLTVPLGLLGSGSLTTTLYARLPGGQSTAPALSYLSSFSGVNARLNWTFCLLVICPACSSSMEGSSDTTFTVSATVASNCLVSATTLDFGSTGVLNANVDSTNTISVTCTNGTPWNASLSAGSGVGGTVALRKMTGPGGATIDYTIYRNAGRTEVWGDGTSGTFTLSGTGTGLAQAQTGYGRVPAQSTPAAATYTDTVVVTITY